MDGKAIMVMPDLRSGEVIELTFKEVLARLFAAAIEATKTHAARTGYVSVLQRAIAEPHNCLLLGWARANPHSRIKQMSLEERALGFYQEVDWGKEYRQVKERLTSLVGDHALACPSDPSEHKLWFRRWRTSVRPKIRRMARKYGLEI